MKRYKIDLDKDYINDQLFTWYLVFSDIINCFSVLKIEHFKDENRNDWKLSTFVSRLIMGYVSEAQKTIDHFLNSDAYNSLIKPLSAEKREEYDNQKENWKVCINSSENKSEPTKGIKGYSFISDIRNSVFHFAEIEPDLQSYRNRFLLLCENDCKNDFVLEYTAGEDNLIASCDLIFVNQLWDYAVREKYKKTLSCNADGKTNPDKNAVDNLMQMFELSYGFALIIWPDLEFYLLEKGIIVEEDEPVKD